ncbi:hypothetical protein [Agarivorans sp.]|uniref:hypothetical protein n=1 Tax=Agarivorans sp. TaxID=1872412 RepID=UPI003D018AAC
MAKGSQYLRRFSVMLVIMSLALAMLALAVFEQSPPAYQLRFVIQDPTSETTLTIDCEHLNYSLRHSLLQQRASSEAVQHLSMLVCADLYALLQQVPKQFASAYVDPLLSEKQIIWQVADEQWRWRWQSKYDPALKPVFSQLDRLISRVPDSAFAGGLKLDLPR